MCKKTEEIIRLKAEINSLKRKLSIVEENSLDYLRGYGNVLIERMNNQCIWASILDKNIHFSVIGKGKIVMEIMK